MTRISDARLAGSMWMDEAIDELDPGMTQPELFQVLANANVPEFPGFDDETLDDEAWDAAWHRYCFFQD